MIIYVPPVAEAPYPPPPPGIALDKKVYLPGILAHSSSAMVCVKDDVCERMDVRTWVGDKPVYFTKDEGWYNMLWMAEAFCINNRRYSIVNYGSVSDLYYLPTDESYSAYITVWLDGQWFFMALVKE